MKRKTLEENIVQITLKKLVKTRLIWKSKDQKLKDDEFLGKYSWIVPESFFSDSARVLDDNIIADIERYGGSGIGVNGGGARVANVNGAQIKGVGANCLVGKGAPATHSYGGLDMQGAVKEIIYSNLLNQLSPIGSQQIFGLLLLDKKSAIYNGAETWSAILVRENCLRPAHLLRASKFRVQPKFKHDLPNDELRIKRLYKNIGNEMGISEFSNTLYKFLDDCANQLSFTRIARIAHAVLSESNIGLDGKLLDTSVCGFVIAGINFCQISDFFSEPTIPIVAVKEMVHTYNKYNYSKINFDLLNEHYQKKFEEFLLINGRYLFGIDLPHVVPLTQDIGWKQLILSFNNLIVNGSPEKVFTFPGLELSDRLVDVLSISLYGAKYKNCQLSSQYSGMADFVALMEQVLDSIYSVYKADFDSKNAFENAILIQALKRAHLASFFYHKYISQMVDGTVDSKLVVNIRDTINICNDTSNWIFEDLNSSCATLFSNGNFAIVFDCKLNIFKAKKDTQLLFESEHAGEIFQFVKNSEINFKILHFNFKPFLLQLCSFLYESTDSTFKGVKNAFN